MAAPPAEGLAVPVGDASTGWDATAPVPSATGWE